MFSELGAEHLPMPDSRRRTLREMCAAIDRGGIGIGAGTERSERSDRLRAVPGIGPWTASYVVMRCLNYPDSFLPTDVGVRHALDRLNVDSSPACRGRAGRALAPVPVLRAAPPLGHAGSKEDDITQHADEGRVPARFGGGRRLAETERLSYALLPSPVGVLTLAASATGLRYVLWASDELTRVPDGGEVVEAETHPVLPWRPVS